MARIMARIYVIEDDKAVRGELATLLRRAGHEPVCAQRFDRLAADALDAAPDVVLLDLGLPGTDGQYVCRELRQSSNVPIMVVTSRATDLDELMSMSLGADDFVTKPYNGQILLARIDALLRRVKGADQVGSRATDLDELMSMSLGADDFVTKPYNGQILLARIDALLRRVKGADQVGRVIEFRGLSLDLARSTASFEGSSVELTKNELRILSLLMRRKGEIVSREEIMVELWNSDAFIDDNTLTVNTPTPLSTTTPSRST